MSTYLVSYDLMSPGQDYKKLHEYLRSFDTRSKPLESLWVIKTTLTAAELRDGVATHVDSNDKVLVVKSGSFGAWRNLGTSTSEWLKKHL